MSDVNANIGVQIDTSLALAELKNLQRQLANFHSAISKSSAAAALAQKNLQTNLVNSINDTGKFRAQMGVIRTSTESFTDALEKNKLGMRDYFRYAGGASKSFGRLFRSEFDTIQKVAVERVKDLQTQYIKLGRDANGAMRAIAVRPLALDMDNYATKTQLAAQRQALFNQLIKQGSTNLLNFGKNTQWAGRQLMVGFSIPLAYLGTTAAKTFMQIEEQAVRFKRVYGDIFTSTGETTKALDNVRQLAKEFTKYGVAVEDTIKVAADAAAAGKVGADLIAQVEQASRLAVLGQVEQQQALETTISLQNAFGQSAEQLAQDINFLNAVENQTVTSIEDLTIAIPKAGPVVKQLGGDVKDLAYFLTAMKEGGINASEGANALKSGLASLINPTEKAAAMLADMGVNITDIVERNKGDLRTTVEEFAAALDTLAPLERSRAIEQLFGKFQFARLSTLFQNVAKEGNQAARVLDLAGASVEELAILSERELKTVEDAIGVDFKEAVQQLRLALEPIGKMFLKTITPIAKVIANLLDKFNGLDEGTQKFIVVVSTLVGVVGPTLLMTFGLIGNALANTIKLFAAIRSGFLKLGGNSKILGEQTDYMTTQQIEANTVAAALNQSHNRLIQTFTAEATAIAALRKAYVDATSAAARFAAANPGMMSPGGRGRTPKKYATGVVQVPGSGNKDTVPSLLTPGEGVVPADVMKNPEAQVLLQALINGELFKYSGGAVLAGESYAHVGQGSSKSIDEILKNPNLTEAQRQKLQVYKDILVANGMKPEARAFHGLAYSFPKELNMRLAGRGVGIQQFEDAWLRSGPNKWISSGLSPAEASAIDKEIINKIKSSGVTNVTDAAVEKAFKELPENIKKTPAYTKMTNLYNEVSAFSIGKGLGSIPSTTKQVLEQAKKAGMIDDFKVLDRVDSKGKVVNSAIVVYKNGKEISLGRGADAERSNIRKRKAKETVAVETGEKKVSSTGKETRLGVGNTTAKPAGVKTTSGSVRDNRTTQLSIGDRIMSRRNAALMRRYKLRGLVDGDLTPAQKLAGSEGISLNKAKRILAEQEKYARAIQESTKAQLTMKDKVKEFSGKASKGAGALTGLTIAASFAGGQIGDMAQQIMPFAFAMQGIAAILPALTNPWGLMVAAVVGVGAMLWKMNRDIDKARQEGIDMGKAMVMTKDKLVELSKITGTVSASEEADRRRQTMLTGASGKQRKTGQTILDSEFGKQFVSDIEKQKKAGVSNKEVAASVATGLSTAIMQGVLTTDQARSMAAALGEQLGSYDIPLQVSGKITQLFGPNGENLENNPLQVALAIKKDSMQQQAQAFQNAISQRKPESDAANNALKVGGIVAGAMAVTASTGGLAGPAALAVSVAALTKAAWDQNKVKQENLKLDTAAIQLGIEAVTQGQGLLDSLNDQYDQKVKQAKTDKEIEKIEAERKNAIEQVNKQNANTLDLLIQQKDQFTDGAFDAAIKASADTMYKEGPMAVFKDQALEVLKGLEDSKFKTELQLGLASGDLDPNQIIKFVEMAKANPEIKTQFDMIVKTSGLAEANVLIGLLDMSGANATTYKMIMDIVAKNPGQMKDIQEAVSTISNILPKYGITINVNKVGVDRLKQIQKTTNDIEAKSKKGPITQKVIQDLRDNAGNPVEAKMYQDILTYWNDLVGTQDSITKEMVIDFTATYSDPNVKDFLTASKAGANVPQHIKDYVGANVTAGAASAYVVGDPKNVKGKKKGDGKTPPGPGERDTSLDDLLKRLRAVRDASINVEGGIGTLTDKFKKSGGEGWKAFKGIENAMLNINSVGKNREFMDYISGLDKKAFATYVNMDKLKKGIFELTAKGKALNMAFNDVKIGEFIKGQQEAAKTSNAQRIAFDKLVKSGMSAELAMQVVADGEMAVAINSKAANGELKKVTKQLTEADNVMKRNAFVEFLRNQNIDIQKKLNLAPVIPQLKQMGMSISQIQEVLGNPTIADGLIAGMKDGKVQAQDVLNLLDQMERTRVAKLIIDIETRGSMPVASDAFSEFQSSFNELYNAASTLVDLKYAPQIDAANSAYEKAVSDAQAIFDKNVVGADKAVADAQNAVAVAEKAVADAEKLIADREAIIDGYQAQIDAIQQNIDAVQKLIDADQLLIDAIDEKIDKNQRLISDAQREIEMIDRKIEKEQELIDAIEREIELNYNRPIEALQEESSDLANDLAIMDKIAEDINKKYDAQAKALEEVQKVNEKIINQQKQQIGLADALTQGDISAAARAVQEIRASNAQAAAGSMSDALQAAREGEIAGLRSASGMTIDQIEQRQFQISQQIYQLEEQREKKQAEILAIQDRIYQLEQSRKPILDQIRIWEDQIYNWNKEKEPIIDRIKANEKLIAEEKRKQAEWEEKIKLEQREIEKIQKGILKDAQDALKAAEEKLKKAEAERAEIEKTKNAAIDAAEKVRDAELKRIEELKKKEMEALDELKKKIDLKAAALKLAAFEAEQLPGLMKEAAKWGYEMAKALGNIFGGVDLSIPSEFTNPGAVPGTTPGATPGTTPGGNTGGATPMSETQWAALQNRLPVEDRTSYSDYLAGFNAGPGAPTGAVPGTTPGTGTTGVPTNKMSLLQGFIELEKQQKTILTMIRDLDIEITKEIVKQFENTKEINKLLENIKTITKDRNLELEIMKEHESDLFDLYTNQYDPLFQLLDLQKFITAEMKLQRQYVGDFLDVKNKDYGLFWIYTWWDEIRKLLIKIVEDSLASMKKILSDIKAVLDEVKGVADQFAASMASAAASAQAALNALLSIPPYVESTVVITTIHRTVYENAGPAPTDPNAPAPTDPALSGPFNKGGYVKFASGGTVPGPSVNRDIVPAMLTPGEYVINRQATSKFFPLLEAINGASTPSFNMGGKVGGMLGFNSGGLVGSSAGSFSGSSRRIAPDISKQLSMMPTARSMSTPSFRNAAQSARTPRFSGLEMTDNRGSVSTPSQNNKSEIINKVHSPVYNYSVNVSVGGSNADPNTIANVVLSRLQNLDSQQIRGQGYNIA